MPSVLIYSTSRILFFRVYIIYMQSYQILHYFTMADERERKVVKTCELRTYIRLTRKTVRRFNNEMTDAAIEHNLTIQPCNECSETMTKDKELLITETKRLVDKLQSDSSTPYFRCCCPASSRGEANDKISATFENQNVQECISITRKAMRDYNDNLDDGRYKREDRRPCQTCKTDITNECDGLLKELERLNECLSRDMREKNSGPCQYGCTRVTMRGGARKRTDSRMDSGIGSVDSEILQDHSWKRDATESLDETPQNAILEEETDDSEQTIPNAGQIKLPTPERDTSVRGKDPKGDYITLDVSVDCLSLDNAGDSHA